MLELNGKLIYEDPDHGMFEAPVKTVLETALRNTPRALQEAMASVYEGSPGTEAFQDPVYWTRYWKILLAVMVSDCYGATYAK